MSRNDLELKHGNIYKDASNNLYIYICDTNLKYNICVTPVKENDGISNILKLSCLNKVAFIDETQEIKRDQLISPLRLAGKTINIEMNEYIVISNHILIKLLDKTKETYLDLSNSRNNNPNPEYILTEDYYKYLTWFDFKTKLEFQKSINNNPGIIKFGIYLAELGENIGSELHKQRPVIIFRKCVNEQYPNQSSYIVIPITSKTSARRYYFNVPITINGNINYAKINDMRRISVKRIVSPFKDSITKKTCVLSDSDKELLLKIFKKYFIE